MNEPLNDEVLDGLPVLPDEPGVSMFPAPPSRTSIVPLSGPAQKTAAAAAGGFVAGAAVLGLVHRRKGKRMALASARSSRRLSRKRSKSVGNLVEVVASRSLLVDVHLLGSPGRGR